MDFTAGLLMRSGLDQADAEQIADASLRKYAADNHDLLVRSGIDPDDVAGR